MTLKPLLTNPANASWSCELDSGVYGLVGATAVAASVLLTGPPLWLLDWLAVRDSGCLYRTRTTAPVVALTFDDGRRRR
jgi:peptidoglycan/xylan/chitin deacetylase (PgdA/CDA1 family)